MSPKAGDLGDPSPISRRLLAPVPRRLLVLALQKLPRRLLVLAPQKLLVSIWIPPVPRRLLSSAPRRRPAFNAPMHDGSYHSYHQCPGGPCRQRPGRD